MIIKNNIFVVALVVLFAIFTSCKKIEESIKRDIIITPAGAEFTIPILSNTTTEQAAANFPDTVNIQEEMEKVTKEFRVSNIRDLKVSAFKLELLGDTIFEDDNLGNIEDIRVEISAGGKKATLAKLEGNSSAKSGSILIPIGVPTADLREILNAPSFNYDIWVTLRKQITVPLRAEVTPSYTITVGF